MRNEKKRNIPKRNEIYQNKTKCTETKWNIPERNETKQNTPQWNEIYQNKTKCTETKWNIPETKYQTRQNEILKNINLWNNFKWYNVKQIHEIKKTANNYIKIHTNIKQKLQEMTILLVANLISQKVCIKKLYEYKYQCDMERQQLNNYDF